MEMNEAVFRRESAVEYFKELVESALAHQHVIAGELTAFYVVHLLSGFLRRPDDDDNEPLGLKLALALESSGVRQKATLKQVGDVSLFMSGFFSDSFRHRLVDAFAGWRIIPAGGAVDVCLGNAIGIIASHQRIPPSRAVWMKRLSPIARISSLVNRRE